MFPLKQNTLRHAGFLIKTFKTYRTPQGCKPACLLLGCATPTQGALLLPAVPGQGRVLPSLRSQPLPTEKEKQPFVCRSAVPFSSCCSLGEQTSLCPLWAYGCGYRHGTALAVAWWPTAARLRFGKMDSSYTSLKAPGECWKAETNGLVCQAGLQTLQTPSSCTMAEGVQEIPAAPIIPQPAPRAERARAAIPAGSKEGWMLFDVHLAAIPFFARGQQEEVCRITLSRAPPPKGNLQERKTQKSHTASCHRGYSATPRRSHSPSQTAAPKARRPSSITTMWAAALSRAVAQHGAVGLSQPAARPPRIPCTAAQHHQGFASVTSGESLQLEVEPGGAPAPSLSCLMNANYSSQLIYLIWFDFKILSYLTRRKKQSERSARR